MTANRRMTTAKNGNMTREKSIAKENAAWRGTQVYFKDLGTNGLAAKKIVPSRAACGLRLEGASYLPGELETNLRPKREHRPGLAQPASSCIVWYIAVGKLLAWREANLNLPTWCAGPSASALTICFGVCVACGGGGGDVRAKLPRGCQPMEVLV